MKKNQFSLIFTGQGAQRTGMAEDFYNEYPLAKDTFQRASAAIDTDLIQICFQEDARINLTEFTQPAILTAEIAMFRVLVQEFGLETDYFAGHSLGEYSSLVAADVIEFEDAVKIVKQRGSLMQKAVPEGIGAMAALIMDNIQESGFAEIVEKNRGEIANINSKQQVVISGTKEAVEASANDLKKKFPEMNIIFLNTSAPFHSSLMKKIENDFELYLNEFSKNFQLEKAEKVLSNFTGDFHKPGELVKNLIYQISNSVKWFTNMENLLNCSSQILEIGPNRVLAKFFTGLDVDVKAIINIRSAKKVFISGK